MRHAVQAKTSLNMTAVDFFVNFYSLSTLQQGKCLAPWIHVLGCGELRNPIVANMPLQWISTSNPNPDTNHNPKP